ncbi:MAG: histidine kinase, partial [Caldimonas sp.]
GGSPVPAGRRAHVRSRLSVGLSRLGIVLTRQRTALFVVAVLVFYLSTQMFIQPHLLDFWTLADLASAWFEYLVELSAMAMAMGGVYAVVGAACRRLRVASWARLAAHGLALYAAAFCFLLATEALRNRHAVSPDVSLTLTSALRWAVIGLYLVAMQALWQRVRETDAQALAAEAGAESLVREHQQLRLQLLKAQIEPHFLFNTLAHVRRLYRTDTGRGEQMMASLKRYLHAALPGVRRDDATLADELALVRSYLALIRVRMGGRLTDEVSDESGQGAMPFPAMVVLTLVENAVKHGIEPSPYGGHLEVRAISDLDGMRIIVRDDGVGIGGADSGGSGVGLANIRSQLQWRYGAGARLEVLGGVRGVIATITIDPEAGR